MFWVALWRYRQVESKLRYYNLSLLCVIIITGGEMPGKATPRKQRIGCRSDVEIRPECAPPLSQIEEEFGYNEEEVESTFDTF
jgi:hypothetical protein